MSRRLLRYLDWPVLVATLILVVGGAVVLYSAVQNSGDASTLVRARILHAVMGLVVLALMAFIDYQTIARAWRPILGTTLFLLVVVLIIGRSSMGAQRWIALGPLGGGYALIQSKIAVGSGQVFGKGLLHGTQNLLHFIPEQHTDFVFTVIGEELGFVGAALMIGLFVLWLWRGMAIAAQAKDRLGMLMAVGAVGMIAFHLFINVGMTLGLMPITGIPLPFISHGGSALVAGMGATRLLREVGPRREKSRI